MKDIWVRQPEEGILLCPDTWLASILGMMMEVKHVHNGQVGQDEVPGRGEPASVAMARTMSRFPSPVTRYRLRDSISSSCCGLGSSEKELRDPGEVCPSTWISGAIGEEMRSCPWSWPRPGPPSHPGLHPVISSHTHQFSPLPPATGPTPICCIISIGDLTTLLTARLQDVTGSLVHGFQVHGPCLTSTTCLSMSTGTG